MARLKFTPGADGSLELRALTDKTTGDLQDDATVTGWIYAGTAAAGGGVLTVGPLAMASLGSGGNYRATLAYDSALIPGGEYYAESLAVAPSAGGARRTFRCDMTILEPGCC